MLGPAVSFFATIVLMLGLVAGCAPEKDDKRRRPDTDEEPAAQAPDAKTDQPDIKLTSDCSAADKYCVLVSWVKGPQTGDFSEARLVIYTTSGKVPKAVEGVTVEPWMKIHGHGTGDAQPEVSVDKDQANIFHVTGIYFIMSGPWELNIEAVVDGAKDKLEFAVKVP